MPYLLLVNSLREGTVPSGNRCNINLCAYPHSRFPAICSCVGTILLTVSRRDWHEANRQQIMISTVKI